jgi:VCBS repeat-containing protein
MKKQTFRVLLACAIALVFTGCSPAHHQSDADIRQNVSGTWTRDVYGTMTIAPDGSWSNMVLNSNLTNFYSGTWQLKDGVIIMTLTNTSVSDESSTIGRTKQYNVIHVDDHHFVYELSGETNTLSR